MDDFSFTFDKNENNGYFSSNRLMEKAMMIFTTSRKKCLKCFKFILVTSLDEITKLPIPLAHIKIIGIFGGTV